MDMLTLTPIQAHLHYAILLLICAFTEPRWSISVSHSMLMTQDGRIDFLPEKNPSSLKAGYGLNTKRSA